MKNFLVVDEPARWELPLADVTILSAREYLTPQAPQLYRNARIFNLCGSYHYQSLGYYVSLLAEARGHHAIPSVATLQDFRSISIARSYGEEIDESIQISLKKETGDEFTLSIYFGQTLDGNHTKLSSAIYRLFPAPLIRAEFVRQDRWILTSVHSIPLDQVDPTHLTRLFELATRYFGKRHSSKTPKQRFLYDMAILVNPEEPSPPSNEKALKNFTEAAREVGFYVETITSNDIQRISEFDALFIRETTSVNHPTYQMSRLAHAEGLIVMDDPWSILRCANKVYLAECLAKAKIPAPRTSILTSNDLDRNSFKDLTFPLVLKLPDAAFSKGVRKVNDADELNSSLASMLEESDLIIAQEFAPSDFDWRIGVLDHQPLFACKYYMAEGHWQVYNWSAENPKQQEGRSETVHVEFAPPAVVELAVKATRLIGDGLYGVDIKQIGNRLLVIEVNDNPNVDAGIEDLALGQELYRRVARSFRRRIQQARE